MNEIQFERQLPSRKMDKSDLFFGQELRTVHLMRKGKCYRWRFVEAREWASPPFDTHEAAVYFAGKIPFLTNKEWKEFYPLKYPESEIPDYKF